MVGGQPLLLRLAVFFKMDLWRIVCSLHTSSISLPVTVHSIFISLIGASISSFLAIPVMDCFNSRYGDHPLQKGYLSYREGLPMAPGGLVLSVSASSGSVFPSGSDGDSASIIYICEASL